LSLCNPYVLGMVAAYFRRETSIQVLTMFFGMMDLHYLV
jgi:hypothetical protein